jgi:hypothetical protein
VQPAPLGRQWYFVFKLMDTPNLPPKPLPTWKRLAIISLSCGAGFALIAALILWGVAWYTYRPTPPKPWNTTVIVAKAPPGFSISNDGSRIDFSYAVENTTKEDYRIDSANEVQVMLRSFTKCAPEPLFGVMFQSYLA